MMCYYTMWTSMGISLSLPDCGWHGVLYELAKGVDCCGGRQRPNNNYNVCTIKYSRRGSFRTNVLLGLSVAASDTPSLPACLPPQQTMKSYFCRTTQYFRGMRVLLCTYLLLYYKQYTHSLVGRRVS